MSGACLASERPLCDRALVMARSFVSICCALGSHDRIVSGSLLLWFSLGCSFSRGSFCQTLCPPTPTRCNGVLGSSVSFSEGDRVRAEVSRQRPPTSDNPQQGRTRADNGQLVHNPSGTRRPSPKGTWLLKSRNFDPQNEQRNGAVANMLGS